MFSLEIKRKLWSYFDRRWQILVWPRTTLAYTTMKQIIKTYFLCNQTTLMEYIYKMVLARNSLHNSRGHLQGSDLTSLLRGSIQFTSQRRHFLIFLEESAIEFLAPSYFHSKYSTVFYHVSGSDKRSFVYSIDTI